ncbi:MAG TPA: AAA family ATPase [Firmicutes bacterium]|nr:AAA family ATPase [Candidatus Fermentithermobacillaceae bacterium]
MTRPPILRSVRYSPPEDLRERDRFPFCVPGLSLLDDLEFTSPVTIFVGENGSGKSTVLEAIAAAAGSITVGSYSVESDPSLEHARNLASHLRMTWTVKTKRGFFMRTEDFFGFAQGVEHTRRDMEERLSELEEEYKGRSRFALMQARSPYAGSLSAIESDYGDGLDAQSHGESILKLLKTRLVPKGLYILDEPESPMSPLTQLAFVALVKDAIGQGSQFLIATHSPVVMACPGATILSLDASPPGPVDYDDLEHVKFMRAFLSNPKAFVQRL